MSDRQHDADDKYARESFTLRTMQRWQVWTLTAAGVGFLALLLIYNWA